MSQPPPRDPYDPRLDPDDETVVVPPDEPAVVDEYGVRDDTYVEEEVVEEPRRRPPLVWPWLLALLLVVLGGLGAYWYFTRADKSEVPAVVGFRQAVAVAMVEEAGFEPTTQREESTKPRDVVISQNPAAGTEHEEGETVTLVVSTGPPKDVVPDVVGQPRDEAVSAVEAAGFDAKVTEVFSQRPEDIVVAQSPAQGTTVKEGAVVELAVSKGGKPVVVPDVTGTTSSEATKTLTDAGFQINLQPVPSDRPAGTVVAQDPAPGATAKQGTSVRVNVAQAPSETAPSETTPGTTPGTTTAPAANGTVPDVVGSELADGARQFADEGLKVAVLYVPSDEPKGRIVAQAKPQGTELAPGETVQLNVANGPDPQPAASVPGVTGLAQQDARTKLEDAGFEVLMLDITGTEGEGPVLSQTPRGAAQVPGGSLVLLYVGD